MIRPFLVYVILSMKYVKWMPLEVGNRQKVRSSISGKTQVYARILQILCKKMEVILQLYYILETSILFFKFYGKLIKYKIERFVELSNTSWRIL